MAKTRIPREKQKNAFGQKEVDDAFAAVALMLQRGESVTVSKVQQKAGLSRGAIYRIPGLLVAIHAAMEEQQKRQQLAEVFGANPDGDTNPVIMGAWVAMNDKAEKMAEKYLAEAEEAALAEALAESTCDAAHTVQVQETNAAAEQPATVVVQDKPAPQRPLTEENPMTNPTPKTFWQHVGEQEGNCKVCKVISISDGPDALVADEHNGVIRGALCKSCLAMMKEFSENFDSLLAYIRPGHVTIHAAELQVRQADLKPQHTEWPTEKKVTVLPPAIPNSGRQDVAVKVEDRKVARELIQDLLAEGPKSSGQVMEALGMARNETYKVLKTMEALGTIYMTGDRGQARWHLMGGK